MTLTSILSDRVQSTRDLTLMNETYFDDLILLITHFYLQFLSDKNRYMHKSERKFSRS